MPQARPKRDRLLEGEDPESLRPQDTRHWISVYREMVAFKEDLLERVTGDLMHVSAAAKTDLNDDITLIDLQLKRYRRRLDYWVQRQLELEEIAIDSKTRTLTYRELGHADQTRVSDPGQADEPTRKVLLGTAAVGGSVARRPAP